MNNLSNDEAILRQHWLNQVHQMAEGDVAVAPLPSFDITVETDRRHLGAKVSQPLQEISCVYCHFLPFRLNGVLGGRLDRLPSATVAATRLALPLVGRGDCVVSHSTRHHTSFTAAPWTGVGPTRDGGEVGGPRGPGAKTLVESDGQVNVRSAVRLHCLP